ncbi:MAG: alpha-2-macroglobulin family protein, partial [Planctomycetota bacterium]
GEALRHDPNSLEARELLASLSAMGKAIKLEATLGRRRNMEKKVRRASLKSEYSKDKYADDDMVADEEEMGAEASNNSAIGIGGGAGGGRGGRFKRPQGGVPPGMREPSDPAAFDSRNINLWPSKYTPPAPVLADARLAGAILMLFEQGGVGAVPPPLHVRADFRDTAFFKAVGLRTDASGKATVTVKMPENLTRWRAVARGISATTLVGETEASFVTRKDLLVRLSKPRFLTDRDTAESTGAVYNTTKQDMEVTSTLSAEGLTVAGGAERKPVQVEAGRLLAQRWTFEKPQPGRAKLTLEARAGRYGDAAESSLPVLAYGIPYRDGWAGSVEQSAVIPVDLPDTAIDGATRLFVSIAPSVDATVVDAVTWLEAFPYGCVEQTVNRFLPALMAERALRRMRSPDAARLNRIREVVEAGLRRLQRAQNPDGSFGWWPGDRAGDPYITALALWGMAEANRGGYRLPGNLLNGVTQALQRMSPALDDEARCFVQCALAVAGRAQLDALNRLYRNRFGLSAGAKALLCIAHDRAGRRFQADELRTLLAQDAVRDADGLHLSGRKDGRWLFGDVEATAYGLMAFLGEKPLSDDAHASVRWLLRHREGFSFGTTKQTGPAALALTAYLRVRGAQHNTGTVTLTVGGDEVGSLEVRDGKLEGRGFAVPTERLKKGRNVLEISVT